MTWRGSGTEELANFGRTAKVIDCGSLGSLSLGRFFFFDTGSKLLYFQIRMTQEVNVSGVGEPPPEGSHGQKKFELAHEPTLQTSLGWTRGDYLSDRKQESRAVLSNDNGTRVEFSRRIPFPMKRN